MRYAAVIYNYYNVVIRVEERPTRERAIKAGKFYEKFYYAGTWYKIVEGDDIELYKSLINA